MIPFNKERKYLLAAGMVLLLAGAVYRFYPSLSNIFTRTDEMIFTENQLSKYREAVREKAVLEAKLLSAQRALAQAEAALLSGETSALAAVEIQNMMNRLGEQQKIRIESMRVLKPKAIEKTEYMTVPVQVAMTASIRQIKDLLLGIEKSRTLLKISNIQIRQIRGNQPEVLSCSFVVEGFMKSREG